MGQYAAQRFQTAFCPQIIQYLGFTLSYNPHVAPCVHSKLFISSNGALCQRIQGGCGHANKDSYKVKLHLVGRGRRDGCSSVEGEEGKMKAVSIANTKEGHQILLGTRRQGACSASPSSLWLARKSSRFLHSVCGCVTSSFPHQVVSWNAVYFPLVSISSVPCTFLLSAFFSSSSWFSMVVRGPCFPAQ